MNACSGIPLAGVMVSQETEQTVTSAVDSGKSYFLMSATYGTGQNAGWETIMINDTIVKQEALNKILSFCQHSSPHSTLTAKHWAHTAL